MGTNLGEGQKYSLRLRHGHDFTVDEDGCDDGEAEHGVGEDGEGDPSDRVEWGEDPHGLCCGEPGRYCEQKVQQIIHGNIDPEIGFVLEHYHWSQQCTLISLPLC